MADMAHGHEVAIVAHGGCAAPSATTAAHRNTFTNDTIASYDESALSIVIIPNLTFSTQHRLCVNDCPRADLGVARYHDVRPQPHILAEDDIGADETKRSDLDAF